jgi:hypothetical protein
LPSKLAKRKLQASNLAKIFLINKKITPGNGSGQQTGTEHITLGFRRILCVG